VTELDELLAAATALAPTLPPHAAAAVHNLAADCLVVAAAEGLPAAIAAARVLLEGVGAWAEHHAKLRPLCVLEAGVVLGVMEPPAGRSLYWLCAKVMKTKVRILQGRGEKPPGGRGVEVGYWTEAGMNGWWRVPEGWRRAEGGVGVAEAEAEEGDEGGVETDCLFGDERVA
jgi:hypothetical protein